MELKPSSYLPENIVRIDGEVFFTEERDEKGLCFVKQPGYVLEDAKLDDVSTYESCIFRARAGEPVSAVLVDLEQSDEPHIVEDVGEDFSDVYAVFDHVNGYGGRVIRCSNDYYFVDSGCWIYNCHVRNYPETKDKDTRLLELTGVVFHNGIQEATRIVFLKSKVEAIEKCFKAIIYPEKDVRRRNLPLAQVSTYMYNQKHDKTPESFDEFLIQLKGFGLMYPGSPDMLRPDITNYHVVLVVFERDVMLDFYEIPSKLLEVDEY